MLFRLNISYWWWFWISLEILNWLLILNINNLNLILLFLIWQSISTLSIIFFVVMYPYSIILIIILIFKIALPPFHYWFWRIISLWKLKNFFIFLYIHKYPTIIVILNYTSIIIWKFLIISPLLIFLFLWFFINLKSIIFSLLILDFIWLLFSWFSILKLLYLYIFLNSMLLIIIIFINKNQFKSILNKVEFNLFILLVFRLPPLVTFIFKWLIRRQFNTLILYIFFFLAVLNIYFYWSIFYLNITYSIFYNIKLLNNILLKYLSLNILYLFL